MRPIKFRIFYRGKMYYEGHLDFQGIPHEPGESGCYELDDESTYTLMQFTGLQDLNGKEIYEGDILKIDNDGECYITHVRDENGTLAVDVINEDYSYIAPGWLQDWCEIEIIGNIHSNPELLETK